MKILLAEDDRELCSIIINYFEEKSGGNIEIKCAYSGQKAINMFYEEGFDIILLDVMLPDNDGFELCRIFRHDSNIPIIFITARHSEEDVLNGYRAGCDDYISKPFSLAQLYVKLHAVFRRSNGSMQSEIISAGNILIDTYSYSVKVEGNEIQLTPKEYSVLKFLLINKDRTVSRNMILEKVWGVAYGGSDRVVDNTIKKLRKSLGKAGRQIKTVISVGYRLEA
ncbi:MAG: response regulator transcription factor [bacterium]|nr:response regulator transcription factor [bacterium]